MKDTKIQWHPGFVAAMNLEFIENRNDLIFDKEHNLNTKPLEIDLLIVKKEPSIQIKNEIGEFFKGHNIMEYKSPKDSLDIDTLHKAMAYAHLYKSYGETVDAIQADDITISLVRETKPSGLFEYFKKHGIAVKNPHHGIYHILYGAIFPIQIIVSGELDQKSHTWLRALSGRMEKPDMEKLLEAVSRLTEKTDKEFADSILEVSIGANRKIAEELRGDNMSPVLLEIMEPVLLEREHKARIEGAVETLRDCGYGDDKIIPIIMEKYQLSQEEATDYLQC